MASITIRLDEASKIKLRIRAAQHGRSMEEEARQILKAALATKMKSQPNLAESIRARFGPLGGVKVPKLPRKPMREPPDFRR